MPARPLLIYDGDCRFCRYSVNYARLAAGEAVDFAPFQAVGQDHPQLSIEDFRESIRLVRENQPTVSGAEAAFTTLALGGHQPIWLRLYASLPWFAAFAERLYAWVSRHRDLSMMVSTFLFGETLEPRQMTRTVSWFLTALGLIYLVAFASLATQVPGLFGSEGITPIAGFLGAVRDNYGVQGYWVVPSIFWFNASDLTLALVAWSGVLIAALLVFRIRPVICLVVLNSFYLSFVSSGQVFMQFQWDILLLEVGFLAMFLRASPNLVSWLFRWLLFRFMFQSGLVKLLSGDQSWRDLTALQYHFESQPLPTLLAWYAHQLPDILLKCGVAATLMIELLVPFLLILPRRLRLWGGVVVVLFEVVILLTGSYNFFNLLTIVLCLMLLDDQTLDGWFRRGPQQAPAAPAKPVYFVVASALVYLFLSTSLLVATGNWGRLPQSIQFVLAAAAPFHVANGYGLFAVMTRGRPELVIQGSSDGENWLAYDLPYKPGRLSEGPRLATPHQPRLDWQLWFAALGTSERNPWLYRLTEGLLSGAEPIENLFSSNPFPQTPPKHVRISLYEYRFSTPAEQAVTGDWWVAEFDQVYFGPAALRAIPGDK